MSIPTILKALTAYEQSIFEVIKEGADLALRGGGTEEERDLYEQHKRDVFKKGNQTFTDEAEKNAREHATKHLMDNHGLGRADAEKMTENVLKNIRGAIQMAPAAGKWIMVKLALAAVLVSGILTYVTGHHETEAEKIYRINMHNVDEMNREVEQSRALTEGLSMSVADFNTMTSMVAAPEPAPELRTPDAQAMPIVVAAAAAAPIVVEVETPTIRDSYVSTVGQVYRNSPAPVQNQIEQHVIQHDYNIDNSAAFTTHLHQMSEDWSRKNFPSSNRDPNNIHVDAVDGNGVRFGSANFHQ